MLPDQADRVGDRIVGNRPSQRCAGDRGGPRRSRPVYCGEGRIVLDAKLAMDVDVIVASRNVPGGRRSGSVARKAEDKERCSVDIARLYGSRQQRRENRLQRQNIGHHPDKNPSGWQTPLLSYRKSAHVHFDRRRSDGRVECIDAPAARLASSHGNKRAKISL